MLKLKVKSAPLHTILKKEELNLQYITKLKMKKIVPIEEGDYYLSKEGYKVFTEKYHLKRGYCCESGCRHCPYGYNTKTYNRN